MNSGSERLPFTETPYYHTGRAGDLKGFDRFLYRCFEIFPGLLSWGTLILVVVLSIFLPLYAAIFIIAFDVYWLLKTFYLSMHLRHNWRRLKHNMQVDWLDRMKNIKHDHIFHLVILPFYKEPFEVVEGSIRALIDNRYDKSKFIVVLAGEERAGEEARKTAIRAEAEFKKHFGAFITTIHPSDLPNEMPGKGSNISFAAEETRKMVLDPRGISYDRVIVSAFDIDTVAHSDYFNCLTWYYLNHPRRNHASFQPVPLYNNNIWQAPAIARVIATSSTFWQMIQQERPEKLATFSSHAVSFEALYKGKYWQRNMVSEDSRIFWNLFLAHDGDYEVVPMAYPVSMDINVAPTFLGTCINNYKQLRRWAWGVENVPYILMGFIKNPRISIFKKIRMSFIQIEGFWSLATNPLLIFLLGWLPLLLGGSDFHTTVLAYNLPFITKNLMNVAMLGLVLSAIISFSLLPPAPASISKKKYTLYMLGQWILIPITIILFGAIPGLDAQTRLMLGKYMGFWVTPKSRTQ